MPARLPNRGHAALLRSILLVLSVGTAILPGAGQACTTLSPEGEAKRERQQARWLRKETDLKVRGSFSERQDSEDLEFQTVFITGVITTDDGRRYRISVPQFINCGFPYYFVDDGSEGLFYLKRSKYREDRVGADGVIDNYDFIHFRPDEDE